MVHKTTLTETKSRVSSQVQTDTTHASIDKQIARFVKDKDKLSQKLQAFEKDNLSLNRDLESAHKERLKLLSVLEENEAKTKDFESDREKLRSLSQQVTEKAKFTESLEKKVQELNEREVKMIQEIGFLKRSLSSKNKEVTAATSRFETFKSSVRRSFFSAISANAYDIEKKLNDKVSQLLVQVDSLSRLLAKSKSALSHLKARIKEQDEKPPTVHGGIDYAAYYDLQHQNKELKSLILKLEGNCLKVETELNQLKATTALQKRPNLEQLAADNENLREQLRAFTTSMIESNEEINALQATVDQLQAKIKDCEEQQTKIHRETQSAKAISKQTVKQTLAEHSKFFSDIENTLIKVSEMDDDTSKIWASKEEALVGKRLILEARLEVKRLRGELVSNTRRRGHS